MCHTLSHRRSVLPTQITADIPRTFTSLFWADPRPLVKLFEKGGPGWGQSGHHQEDLGLLCGTGSHSRRKVVAGCQTPPPGPTSAGKGTVWWPLELGVSNPARRLLP